MTTDRKITIGFLGLLCLLAVLGIVDYRSKVDPRPAPTQQAEQSNICQSFHLARKATRDMIEFAFDIELPTPSLIRMLQHFHNMEIGAVAICLLPMTPGPGTCSNATDWHRAVTEYRDKILAKRLPLSYPPEVVEGFHASSDAALSARVDLCSFEGEML